MYNISTYFEWSDVKKCMFLQDIQNNLKDDEIKELATALIYLINKREVPFSEIDNALLNKAVELIELTNIS